MPKDPECIFCKIVAGEIPSFKVYEDERFYAFMDINPSNKGHCLLIPKDHYPDVHTIPDDLLQALAVTSKTLAAAVVKGLSANGLNFIQSNGRAANQIIDHYHLHLIPRWEPDDVPLNWEMIPGDMDEIAAAAQVIKDSL